MWQEFVELAISEDCRASATPANSIANAATTRFNGIDMGNTLLGAAHAKEAFSNVTLREALSSVGLKKTCSLRFGCIKSCVR